MDLNYLIYVATLVVGFTMIALWADRYDKTHPAK